MGPDERRIVLKAWGAELCVLRGRARQSPACARWRPARRSLYAPEASKSTTSARTRRRSGSRRRSPSRRACRTTRVAELRLLVVLAELDLAVLRAAPRCGDGGGCLRDHVTATSRFCVIHGWPVARKALPNSTGSSWRDGEERAIHGDGDDAHEQLGAGNETAAAVTARCHPPVLANVAPRAAPRQRRPEVAANGTPHSRVGALREAVLHCFAHNQRGRFIARRDGLLLQQHRFAHSQSACGLSSRRPRCCAHLVAPALRAREGRRRARLANDAATRGCIVALVHVVESVRRRRPLRATRSLAASTTSCALSLRRLRSSTSPPAARMPRAASPYAADAASPPSK